jgi:N-acyl homoserine lactone hydrolase
MEERPTIDLAYPGVWGRLHVGDRKAAPILLGICSVPIVRSGGRTIIVDTGHFGTRLHLIAALERLSLTPADVDTVVLTHLHWDHILNVDLFPQAEVVLHKDAMAYALNAPATDWAAVRYADRLLAGFRVTEVREGDEIAAGVMALDTPGHTPSDLSVFVNVSDGGAVVASDAVTNAKAFIDRMPRMIFHDEDAARRSVDKIAEAATLIYPGHDRPFRHDGAGGVEYTMDGYLDLTCVEWFGSDDDYEVVLRAPAKSARMGPPDLTMKSR